MLIYVSTSHALESWNRKWCGNPSPSPHPSLFLQFQVPTRYTSPKSAIHQSNLLKGQSSGNIEASKSVNVSAPDEAWSVCLRCSIHQLQWQFEELLIVRGVIGMKSKGRVSWVVPEASEFVPACGQTLSAFPMLPSRGARGGELLWRRQPLNGYFSPSSPLLVGYKSTLLIREHDHTLYTKRQHKVVLNRRSFHVGHSPTIF